MLRMLHKLTFFVWLAAVGLHVLGHLVELPRLAQGREPRRGPHCTPAGIERPRARVVAR